MGELLNLLRKSGQVSCQGLAQDPAQGAKSGQARKRAKLLLRSGQPERIRGIKVKKVAFNGSCCWHFGELLHHLHQPAS